MPHRATRFAAVAAASVLALTACGGVKTESDSDAESYPDGDIELTNGQSPGGSTDLISRQVAKGLGDALDTNVPVVNREGANGALAAKELLSAPDDGTNIQVQNASLFAITPLAVGDDEIVDIKDYDVVGGISRDDYVLVTSADSGFKSIKDLKKANRTITYATTGVGTGSQLSTLLMLETAKIPGKSVPFNGGNPAMTAVLGNQVDLATTQIGESLENIESGKLIPLTVFSDERVKDYLPDTPTAKEQGVDVTVSQYRFLMVPKGTPEDIQDKLRDALDETFATEEYKKFNEANALTPMEIPGDEVVAQLEEDRQRYADLVEKFNLDLTES